MGMHPPFYGNFLLIVAQIAITYYLYVATTFRGNVTDSQKSTSADMRPDPPAV